MRVGHRAWVSGRVTHTGRAAGASSKARSGTARGKRQGLACRSSECAAQVIFGIGVTTRKAGASESQYSADLVGRYAAAQQPLGDPQICNTPIGRGETLGNLQAVQAARIDANGGGGGERGRNGRRRQRNRRASRREGTRRGLKQRDGMGGELRLSVQQFDPRRETAGLTACGFLVGEAGQPAAMTPFGAGAVCAVQMGQLSGDGGSDIWLERSQADTNPSLEMAGAGAQHDTRSMSVRSHRVDGLVVGAIQIEENVAGVAIPGKGVKEDVVSFAIAQPQECHPRGTCELLGGPNLVGGKGLSAQGVNQTKLIIVARHGRQLSAHGLQGEEESAIHDRDSNIGSGSAFLKEEVFTLQKRGSFHFALTDAWPPRQSKHSTVIM